MKKQYGMLFIASWVLPPAVLLFVGEILDIKNLWILSLVLSFLMSSEITAKYNNNKFIWHYISRSIVDKFSFTVSLVIALIPLTIKGDIDGNIEFSTTIRSIISLVGLLIAVIVFLITATPSLKSTIFHNTIRKEESTTHK